MDLKFGQKYKGFSKFKKGNHFRHVFFYLKKNVSQNQMNECDCTVHCLIIYRSLKLPDPTVPNICFNVFEMIHMEKKKQ